jgi:hypothetical protein
MEMMGTIGTSSRVSTKRLAAGAGVLLGWAVALWTAHYSMLGSQLRQIQGNGELYVNSYFLEIGYRFATGMLPRADFWNPLCFFPAKNVMAYSDLMFSFLPFYAPWRLVGIEPDTAFQLWVFSVTTVNYVLCFAFLRKCIGAGYGGAILGATFFSAAGPRIEIILHHQLLPQVFLLLAFFALFQIFGEVGIARRKRRKWILILFGAFAAQFWGGFYMGFFLMLSISFCAAWALLWPAWRKTLFNVIRKDAIYIAVAAIALGAVIAPAAIHYIDAQRELGGHSYDEIKPGLVPPCAWFYPGPNSLTLKFISQLSCFNSLPFPGEQGLGLGVVTLLAVGTGLFLGRKRPGVILMLCASLTIVAFATYIPSRQWSLWGFLFYWVPGMRAIRIPSRIGLMLLYPAAVGLACMTDALIQRGWVELAGILAALCMAEQIVDMPYIDKSYHRQRIAAIASAVPRGAAAFYFVSPQQPPTGVHLDAMWASLETGVPTMNGYSGNFPTGYSAWYSASVTTSSDWRLAVGNLMTWIMKTGFQPAQVAWCEEDGDHVTVSTAKAMGELLVAAAPTDKDDFPELRLGETLAFNNDKADAYLEAGWSGHDADSRWTDGPVAQVHFSMSSIPTAAVLLRISCVPHLDPHFFASQNVKFYCNGRPVAFRRLTDPGPQILEFTLPARFLLRENLLTLSLPDATAPWKFRDFRSLGLAVAWMKLDSIPEAGIGE